MKPLYVTQVSVVHGRTGSAKSTDSRLDVALSLPKAFGGDDGAGTNPEQLFGAGYAACFATTLYFVALGRKLALETPKVVSTVEVLSDPTGGFQLRTALDIERQLKAVSTLKTAQPPHAIREIPARLLQ